MGCFLTITRRDFAQLSATMKASISEVSSAGFGNVKIQVHSSHTRSARQMAKAIRRQTKGSRIASASATEQARAIPTRERIAEQAALLAEVNPVLFPQYAEAVAKQARSAAGAFVHARGKRGEQVAKQILEDSGYLRGTRTTVTSSTSVDVKGRNLAKNQVVVEVKTSDKTTDFSKLLSTKRTYKDASPDGKGYRQVSDGWILASSKKAGQPINLENTTVLGVHLNPSTRKATIYRRVDSNATQWKPLMTRNLTGSELEQLGY